MLKYFVAVILFTCSLLVYSEESYSVIVGTYDINDPENLKFILELKKFVPKENSVVIYDSNYILSKTLIIENFGSEKEAVAFKEKLKGEFNVKVEKSYIMSSDLKNKLHIDGAKPKFNLLVVKSKNELPLKELSQKFKNKIIDIKTKKSELYFKLPIYEKGSKQDEEEGATAIIKSISNVLIDNKVLDFNFDIQDYIEDEVITVLEVNVTGNYPNKEFKEKFKSYLIDKKYNNGFILLRLSICDNDLSQEEIASTSNLIKELSKLFLTWNISDFSFTVQKYREKDDQIIHSMPIEKEEALIEKSDKHKPDIKDEKNIEDKEQTGIMGNIGGGGGGGGSFGQRSGGGRKRAVMRGGGSKETESAVDWALWWLANHQEKDGHWDSGKFEGGGTPEVDVAVTATALLAFLGAGHTDRAGKWKTNVKSAVDWLVKSQKPNGSWDARNYANGICAMAMSEVAGMGCGGEEVKKSAELVIDYLLKQQNASGFFDYIGPSARDDMSATGWCISAYKSAMLACIKVEEINAALKKCGAFLDKEDGTKDNSITSKGEGWYTPGSTGTGSAGGACQAIAMMIRQNIGWAKTEPWMAAAINSQISHIPGSYAVTDIYRVYYATLVLFQHGGSQWETWNDYLKKIIVGIQRQDGDFKGSWDKNGCHLDKGGRVMYTALLCLTLEAYYRYKVNFKE